MATVKELMDHAREMIDQNRAQAAEANAIFKFVLDGDGGGTYTINLKDNPGVVEADDPAECTVKMSAKDFVEMAEERVDSRQLFFMGKLKIDGDVALALRLKKILKTLI